MRARDSALLILLSTIWGSAFMFNELVVREVPPLTVVGGRLLLAALLLASFAASRGGVMPPRDAWAPLVFLAVFNNVVPFALITSAQQHIASSLAATLVATGPLFTVMFAYALAQERLDTEQMLGLAAGFAGVAVLVGPTLSDITGSDALGELAVIAASACYSISIVVARRTSSGNPLTLASGQMIFGAAIATPLALAVDGAPDLAISAKAAGSWLALGALSSGIAYIIFFALVQRLTATELSLYNYLIPVVGTLLGWLVLDERVGVNLLAGLVLIIGGVMAVNGNLRSVRERLARGRERARAGAPPDTRRSAR